MQQEQLQPLPTGLQLGGEDAGPGGLVQDLGVAQDPQGQELGADLHCTAMHCNPCYTAELPRALVLDDGDHADRGAGCGPIGERL